MSSPKLYGMMRVKNEAPWIQRSLVSLFEAGVEKLHVLDDDSTDGTRVILTSHAAVNAYWSPFTGLDEARDKNYLLGRLLDSERNLEPHDWIICIDGDEELVGGSRELFDVRHQPTTADAYSLKIEYLWDAPEQVRVDGWLGTFWRGSLFRVGAAKQGFRSTTFGNGANLHTSNIPGGFDIVERLPVRVKHYGYMHKADRIRKYKRNIQMDPANIERYESLYHGSFELREWDKLEPLA